MTNAFAPTDQQYRDRIRSELGETIFVEAGAGTGKTTSLVSRIANLITSGKATIESIAAITFTEAAAAELRDRVRHRLEQIAGDNSADEGCRQRCIAATRRLDSACIQTLHSFAGSLLRERPLEAGLPPGFEVVDEVGSDINFEECWQTWLDEALESEDTGSLMLRALKFGLKLDSLKDVARSFHLNYDLLPSSFALEKEPERKAVQSTVAAAGGIKVLLACNLAEDALYSHAGRVCKLGDRLASLEGDPDAALCHLVQFGKLSCRSGKKTDWDNVPDTKTNACTALKDILKDMEEAKAEELEAVRRAVLMPLLERVRVMVTGYEEERKEAGKAEFHDLLVWARDLLRHSAVARRHFQRRFTHILIDEFQDTDPIQAEIAFYLAASEIHEGKDGEPLDWTQLKLVPGKLFVVGDPKQSIYRFRRADIAAVEAVCRLMGGNVTPLQQNFRSQEPIIAWVNSVFSKWMGAGEAGIQAAYKELTHRWKPEDSVPHLGVHRLGQQVDGRAIDVRREEAQGVAGLLQQVRSGWKIRAEAEGPLRTAEYRDVCVLMPARTCLPQLERALDQANVPFRVESQSLVLSTHDVQELLSCLRAIDSPVDQVALIAALRSSAFACSDAELLKFVQDGGRFDYTQPGKAGGPVQEALLALHEYHRKRLWTPPDELIEAFVRDRKMMEVSFGRLRPRERLRRLRLVVDQAGAFRRTVGGSLRAFLDWIERLADERVRLAENVTAEADEDAVRIMTIHSAKGLEFPVVVLIGLGNSRPSRGSTTIYDLNSRNVEVSIGTNRGGAFCTAGYTAAMDSEKLADEAEDARLMYVAATRARDHLVVSLYRKATKEDKSLAGTICRLAGEEADLWDELGQNPYDAGAPVKVVSGDKAEEDSSARRDEWVKNRRRVLELASRPTSLAVTSLARIDKEEAEQGEVFYQKGRGGTNLGRAVHSVLQSIDLATGANLDNFSRAQAAAEGMPDRWGEVRDLSLKALESSAVKRAVASGSYHREVFVGLPVSDTVLEGFIDLLFEEQDGVVIVDYKTDAIGEQETEETARRYRLQAGAYILAVQKITGRKVKEVTFVFLRPQREETLTDVAELAMSAQEAAVSAIASSGNGL